VKIPKGQGKKKDKAVKLQAKDVICKEEEDEEHDLWAPHDEHSDNLHPRFKTFRAEDITRRKVSIYHGRKSWLKGSFFMVNDSLTTICLPWSIDRYGSFCHGFSMTMVDGFHRATKMLTSS
jgi:hypothetical protein